MLTSETVGPVGLEPRIWRGIYVGIAVCQLEPPHPIVGERSSSLVSAPSSRAHDQGRLVDRSDCRMEGPTSSKATNYAASVVRELGYDVMRTSDGPEASAFPALQDSRLTVGDPYEAVSFPAVADTSIELVERGVGQDSFDSPIEHLLFAPSSAERSRPAKCDVVSRSPFTHGQAEQLAAIEVEWPRVSQPDPRNASRADTVRMTRTSHESSERRRDTASCSS